MNDNENRKTTKRIIADQYKNLTITSKIKKSGLKFLTPEKGILLPQDFPPSDSLKEYVREGIRTWVDEIKNRLDEE